MTDDQEIRIYRDGDQWCALRGPDLQEGVSGFGETPEEAFADLIVLQSGTPGFDRIHRALRIARVALDSTVPVCNALACIVSGYVCSGCPAEDTVCAVQAIRDKLAQLLEGS